RILAVIHLTEMKAFRTHSGGNKFGRLSNQVGHDEELSWWPKRNDDIDGRICSFLCAGFRRLVHNRGWLSITRVRIHRIPQHEPALLQRQLSGTQTRSDKVRNGKTLCAKRDEHFHGSVCFESCAGGGDLLQNSALGNFRTESRTRDL